MTNIIFNPLEFITSKKVTRRFSKTGNYAMICVLLFLLALWPLQMLTGSYMLDCG